MATEVLQPQDILLLRRFRPAAASPSLPRRKPHQHFHHKRSSQNPSASCIETNINVFSNASNTDTRSTRRRKEVAAKAPAGSPGEVDLLDLAVYRSSWLGPDPSAVPKLYAGSGFSVSPAPSDLPLPSFSKKLEEGVNQSATKDLLRILGLS